MLRSRRLRLSRRSAWRGVKIALGLILAITLLPVLIGLGGMVVACRPWSDGSATTPPRTPEQTAATADIANYARPEDQTYLTLPEWYIVYSADEYAAFIKQSRPSGFPYFRSITQFWSSYYDMCGVTREQYAFNGGYHLTISVIGASFTVENIWKGLYENTVGRLAELLSTRELSAEDAYAREVAAEYGTFLHTIPWYEFPFSARLAGLWQETPFWGPNPIRKAERKLALSAEYGTKAGYGWLIRQGTRGVYEPQDLEINVWAAGVTPAILAAEPDVKVAKQLAGDSAILTLTRYEEFTQTLPRLAQAGVRFVEIAGNDEILVTVLAPNGWQAELAGGREIFAQPILTRPDRQRVALKVPVAELHTLLRSLGGDVTLEHIYDY